MITGEWRCACGVLNEYQVDGKPYPLGATRVTMRVSCGECGRGTLQSCRGIPEGEAAEEWFTAMGRPISEGETE